MLQITLNTIEFIKNVNTKTTFLEVSNTTKIIDALQHNLLTNKDTCSFFRRLGGTETIQKNYTCAGYVCTKLTSTNPTKEIKKVRKFSFKWID